MVRKLLERLVDDIDGSEAVDTLRFAISGIEYEIDLSDANRKKFWETWEPWMKAARQIKRRRPRRTSSITGRGNGLWTDPTKVREYARYIGLEVNTNGLPNSHAQRAYVQAWLDDTLPPKFR